MSIYRSSLTVIALAVLLLVAADASAQYSRVPGSGSGYRGFGGGQTGSASPHFARPNNLSLVVAQTQEGHEGVADLLGQLRRLQDQQVRQEVRFNTVNDSFYERQGVNFGFNLRGSNPASGSGVVGLNPLGQPTPNGDLQFRQGGAASATPQFGGHDPASDGTIGFATRGSEGDLLFNFFSGQGSTRSNVTQAPVIVTPNGGQGFFSDTSQTPFVTGVIPVVGAPSMPAITGYGLPIAAPPQSVVQHRLQQLKYEGIREAAQNSGERGSAQTATQAPEPANVSLPASGPSSADRGDLSVAEIRRQHLTGEATAAEDAELVAWIERARGAEAAGKANVALIYYKMAARRASGNQKQELTEKIRELDGQ